jgi:hypothetical protein
MLEPISMAAARRLGVPDDLLDASAPALADAAGATADGAVASTHSAVSSPGADGVEEAYGEAGGSVLCVSHVTATSQPRHSHVTATSVLSVSHVTAPSSNGAHDGAHDGASSGNGGGPIDEIGGARGSSGGLGGAALRGGDLLLSIDGVPIRSLLAADAALQGKDEVTVQLVSELDARIQSTLETHSTAPECLPERLSDCL